MNLKANATTVRELHLDVDLSDLAHEAKDVEFVVVRLTGLRAPSGRPTSKTVRIPASALDPATGW